MEEQIKKIEIPNFITIKIVKINEIYSASYVESFSDKYFYRNEFDQMVTHLRYPMPYSLHFNNPVIIENSKLEDLEDKIYKLNRELTKFQIPRAERKKLYYMITSDFHVIDSTESNHRTDNQQYIACNYFLDGNQAKRFASKIQNYIIELWKEELKNGN